MKTNHQRSKVRPGRADWRQEYLEKYYSDRGQPLDRWPSLVKRYARQGARVLEIGGGPVELTTKLLRERAAEIVGLDIDPLVRGNPLLDEAIVYDGGVFPLADGRFDLAVSRWVNEHLPDPGLHFKEVHRALAPGGYYLFRTVNLYHYKMLGASILPHGLKARLVRWLTHMPSDWHDPYPAYYRANTRRQIKGLSTVAGFVPVSLDISEEYPGYGMAFKSLFIVLMCYERLVNSSRRFEGLRHTIDCVLQKPAFLDAPHGRAGLPTD
jgi:SAM-dependent methyltransferase